ncbi:hypothetical protein GHH61_23535 [Salmonella enterica]|nr:hypothetical protein [Salmonella enterica]
MAKFRKDPPPVELRQMIYYHDGELYWFPEYRHTQHHRTDKPIGTSKSSTGYKTCRLSVNGEYRSYLIHRLIWWLLYDEWPEFIDHLDRDKFNNKINNLRVVTHSQNMLNIGVKSKNKCGYSGVVKEGKGWRFAVSIDNNRRYVGGYKTKEAAALARDIVSHLVNRDFTVLNILDNPSLSVK